MNDTLRQWLLVVAPLGICGITVIAWSVLILIQTPPAFRRDRFNISLFGTIVTLGLYLLGRAMIRAGMNPPLDVQVIIGISMVFALAGWPAIIRRFKLAIEYIHRREPLP